MVLRDKGRCSFEKYGRRCNRRRFLNIHHIKPVKDGGQNTVDNLATLCETHHIYLHHKEEIEVYGRPEIFNSDQGSQYTSNAFIALLSANEIAISTDGVGRALGNVYIERFWRSLKYEDIYLRDYQSIGGLKQGLSRFISFYNSERPHQSLGYPSPDDLYVGVVQNKAKHLKAA